MSLELKSSKYFEIDEPRFVTQEPKDDEGFDIHNLRNTEQKSQLTIVDNMDDEFSQIEIRLHNIRNFCVFAIAILWLTDIVLIYPKINEKPLFPNRLCIIAEGILLYAMIAITVYSY